VTEELIERGHPLEMCLPGKIVFRVMGGKFQIIIQRVLTKIGKVCHEREGLSM
jgi:hypothetical protein